MEFLYRILDNYEGIIPMLVLATLFLLCVVSFGFLLYKMLKNLYKLKILKKDLNNLEKYSTELTAFSYMTCFTLGLVGYLQTNEFDFASAFYNSLKLFTLGYDTVDDIPLILNISRFLSPLVLASSIYIVLKEYLDKILLAFRIKQLTNHTIIFCGTELDVDILDKQGNTLFVTNALCDSLSHPSKNINDIEKVNIKKAKKIILFNDDRTNLTYLKEINKRFPQLKELNIYIKLEENENVRMFNRFKLKTNFKNVILINPRQLFSRQVVLKHPALDYVNDHKQTPHSLISGEYENIKWLIFEMANISHYPSLKNLKVTLVGNQSKDQKKRLIDEFPNIDQVIDISTIVKASNNILKDDISVLDVTAIYISEKTLEESQITASHLKRILHSNTTNSITTCVMNFGLGLIDDIYKTAEFNKNFHINYLDYKMFGDSNIIQHLDLYDGIAKSIHNYFQKLYGGKDWHNLSESIKMSNRYQAYHTNIKLGYLGYIVDIDSKGNKIDLMYTESQLNVLAKIEKRRWNAERLLGGWIYGEERNNELRIHNLLVPWEKLNEIEQQKDRDTILNITNTINSLGYSITKFEDEKK